MAIVCQKLRIRLEKVRKLNKNPFELRVRIFLAKRAHLATLDRGSLVEDLTVSRVLHDGDRLQIRKDELEALLPDIGE